MIAKMTPIEWLVNEANLLENNGWILPLIEQAKEMEKLKNHSEYMRGWYNGFNSKEIETKGLEKTAIEWFANEIKGGQLITNQKFKDLVEQAKEMEKQQMFDYVKNKYVIGEHSLKFHQEKFEKYYNETFK